MDNVDYIELKFDIFEYAGQRAEVRKTLQVKTLIEEILREFDDIPTASHETYALYLKGTEDPLDEDKTLTELDIQPHDELVFDHLRKFIRRMLDPKDYAFVVEENTGKIFDIQWQPAIIGRPSTDMDHNIMLAVNLQLLPDGITISRKHAQITCSDGRYFIEALAENNPVYLNGKQIAINKKKEIKKKDKLQLGPRKICLSFETQDENHVSKPNISVSKIKTTEAEPIEPLKTMIEDPSQFTEPIKIANLILKSATGEEHIGKTIQIDDFPYRLGRANPILLNESQVSRKHIDITLDEDERKMFVTDLESTNGVSIDGKSIPANSPQEVYNGSKIGLGTVVVFELSIS